MPSLISRFETVFNRINYYLASIVAVSIGLFAVLIPLNLFLLKTGWGSMGWLYEAVEYALYDGVFLAAPWVLHMGSHVRVDVITQALGPKSSARLDQAVDYAGALLCMVLSSYGLRSAIAEFRDGTLPDKNLRIDTGYVMAIFALAFLMLAIEFLLRVRRAKVSAAEKAASAPEAGF